MGTKSIHHHMSLDDKIWRIWLIGQAVEEANPRYENEELRLHLIEAAYLIDRYLARERGEAPTQDTIALLYERLMEKTPAWIREGRLEEYEGDADDPSPRYRIPSID